ncbi:site-2 protease family protein [Candidatus Micrarchaeota archaeon]|nr:site-2 protease family protein [Candidatus Micrarchaeota archaeon]
MYFVVALVLFAFAVFYGILQLDVPGTWKFFLAAIEMLVVNQILIRKYNLSSELGLILFKSQKGLEFIDRLARSKIFNFFADGGLTMGYGLASFLLFKRAITLRSFVLGLILLGFVSVFVAPTAFYFLVNVVKINSMEKATVFEPSSAMDASLYQYAIFAILLLGGLFLFIIFGLVAYGFVVLKALYSTFVLGIPLISKTASGASLMLPGVNLPFIEGILALAIVLIVHEGAHAVLARIGKIPILSSGIVLFGIIPIGAFVEPDEKELSNSDTLTQTRVLVAGSTSNLVTSSIFFVLYLAFILIMNLFSSPIATLPSFVLGALKFIYVTLGLTFSLNFIVGTVNLLPVPLFDGYRLLDINVKNKLLIKILSYSTVAFFIINFLPSFFHG